jgi:alpha-mannosidase
VHGEERSGGAEPVEVRMRAELRAGERFCRITVEFHNRCADHRVRLHVPLARPADRSYAEGQFAVTSRGLVNEGGHGEEPVPTYPAYGFVDAGGVAVLLDHVTEYELIGGCAEVFRGRLGERPAAPPHHEAHELALTLLRATGQISRSIHPYRIEPAGPELATPQAQCLRPVTARMAVLPHAGDWSAADVLGAAEAFHCDLVAAPGTGASGGALTERAGLSVSGDGVRMTSLRRRGELLELRLAAMSPEPTTATVDGVAWARRADLLGNPGDPLTVVEGRLTLPMRPWEIATVQLG